jgi:hypothetical protein
MQDGGRQEGLLSNRRDFKEGETVGVQVYQVSASRHCKLRCCCRAFQNAGLCRH